MFLKYFNILAVSVMVLRIAFHKNFLNFIAQEFKLEKEMRFILHLHTASYKHVLLDKCDFHLKI